MKNMLKTVFVCLTFTFCCGLFSQVMSVDPSEITVDKSFVRAPEYTTGSTGYSALPRPAEASRWLLIRVTYVPRTEDKKIVWEDEVSLEVTVVIPGTSEYGKWIILTGKQVLWSVPADARKHYALFAVPPCVFTQYSVMKAFSKTDVDMIPVAVVLYRGEANKNNRMAVGYASCKNITSLSSFFTDLFKKKDTFVTIQGGVLPKDKTPWQWVDADKFDLPKNLIDGGK